MTKKQKKGTRERRRTYGSQGKEGLSIDLRASLREKVSEKRGKRKTEKHGTPESDENVPSDREFLDATIYHPPRPRSGNGEGTRAVPPPGTRSGGGCPGRIGGCARESFITIPSILRFAAPRLRQREVVNRFERFTRLQIAIFPEEKLVDLG